MKILVTGSRSWRDAETILNTLKRFSRHQVTVIHGGARGVDTIAGRAATKLGYDVLVMPAEWDRYGKKAGFLRNTEMLKQDPDLVLAFWDGDSRGTGHMIRESVRYGITTIITPERTE